MKMFMYTTFSDIIFPPLKNTVLIKEICNEYNIKDLKTGDLVIPFFLVGK